MDEETFEALAKLEGRIDAIREAWLELVIILTFQNDELLQRISTGLFGVFVDEGPRNPHPAFLEEIRGLGNAITSLAERRAENENSPADDGASK